VYAYIARRLVQSIVVIFGVMTLSFVALQAGGDPTYLYISERATPDEIEATRQRFGFDRPIYEQYLRYLQRVLSGDFGTSLRSRVPAWQLVLERVPATIELTVVAIALSTSLAIPIGIVAALYRGKWLGSSIMLLAMLGQSMPSFFLGIVFILVIGLRIRWLPISGYAPIFQPLFAGDLNQLLGTLPDALRYLAMPSLTIAIVSLSRNARLVRSSMLDILNQDYIRTARAKGVVERRIILRHGLPNVLIPLVTLLGLEFGFLLSGVVVVETVFSWPGLGRLVFNAISQRDIPVVQASVILFSLVFVSLNLLTDLIYVQLDPRIKLS
jgi:peptide/nickel transport system permease protein